MFYHWDEPPSPLKWVHSKHGVSSWAVSEEGSQESLLHETSDEDLVLHSLLEDGESSGLADEDIGPLDDDDSGEEHSVASELDDLSLRVSPLLTVGILKSHTSLVVPVDSESHEIFGQETVLHHDDGVADEAGEGLDHTDLTVSHGDQSLVDELVGELVSWVSLHDVGLGLFVGEGDGGEEISSQIDAEDGDGSERKGNGENHEDEEGSDFGNVGSEGVGDGLLQVVEDQSTFLNTSDDGSKVVIKQDHVSGLFGDIRTGNTHGNTDIGLLERWGIVDTITSDGDDLAGSLATIDDDKFLLGRSSGEHDFSVMSEDIIDGGVVEITEAGAVDNSGLGFSGVDFGNSNTSLFGDVFDGLVAFGDDSDRSSDGLGGDGVITSDHDDLDTSRSALGDGVGDGSSWGIDHGHEANESKAGFGVLLEVTVGEVHLFGIEVESLGERSSVEVKVGKAEDSLSHATEGFVGSGELGLPFLGHFKLFAVDHDLRASREDSLWGTLHDKEHSLVGSVLGLVDGKLPLVDGVEGDLGDLGVLGSDSFDGAHHQLAALEKSGFGGITGSFSLENWASFTSKEDSSVAESGNSSEVSPGSIVLVGDVVSGLILSRVSFLDLVVEPHVSDGHSVLGQSTGLVGADGGGGTKGLDSFQVLDEAVLLGHSLGGEREADSDSGEETFGDIGDNNTDQEDDSFEPVVAEDEGEDEEDDSEEDGDTGNDMDEMLDF